MKRRSFAAFVALFAMSATLLSGCQQAAPVEKDPEVAIKEALLNFVDVTSYKYEFEVKGDLNDPTAGNLKLNLLLSGLMDVKDPTDPKFSINANGSVAAEDGTGGSGSGEAMMNKESLYLKLDELNIEGEEGAMPAEMEAMLGKWFQMALPEGTFDQLTTVVPTSGDEEQKAAVKTAIEENFFFKNPQYVGSDSIMGQDSSHYTAEFDSEAFLAFAKKTAEEQGETVLPEEYAQAQEEFKKIDIAVDVWIGTDSNVVTQFVADIKMNDPEVGGEITVRASLGDINKPVTLDLPEDAEELPISGLLGPGLVAPGDDDSMMMDSSMMDDSAMTDMSDDEFNAMMNDAMDQSMDEQMPEMTPEQQAQLEEMMKNMQEQQ